MVRLHGQNQALLRHIQKLFIKITHHHGGALHQAGHFLHQRVIEQSRFGLVVTQMGRLHFQTATQPLGFAAQRLHHQVAAFVKAGDHHTIARQGGGVIIGMCNQHWRHKGFKTVALGTVTGLQAQRMHRHHGAAMQSQQAMRRAHKTHRTPTGQVAIALQLVAHQFGDRQLGNRIEQSFLQAIGQSGATHRTVKVQSLGFAIQALLQTGNSLGSRAQGLQLF